MKQIDQEDPCTSVVSNYGDEVVDGRDKRTGRNRRIDLDLMEEHRNESSDQTADDHENSKKLRERIPEDVIFVSESGIRDAADVEVMRRIGANAVLVGETLMRAEDKTKKLQELRGK